MRTFAEPTDKAPDTSHRAWMLRYGETFAGAAATCAGGFTPAGLRSSGPEPTSGCRFDLANRKLDSADRQLLLYVFGANGQHRSN